MTVRRLQLRVAAAAATTLIALLAGCASANMIPAGRLTPVRDRVTDEAIARDLAIFDDYERRLSAAAPSPSGAQRYLAARATEYVRIARDAYERNDRTDFVEDALAWAAADIETLQRDGANAVMPSAVPMPKGTQRSDEALWARADGLRRDVGSLSAPDDIARAEGQLMRAGYTFLAGPACIAESPLVAATRYLNGVDGSRLPSPLPVLDVTPTQPMPVRPPLESTPPATPSANCATPERLAGVPTMVHFALDKSFLAPTTKAVLDELVGKIGQYAGIQVVLSGHTDVRASDDYNQALSERRVNSVRSYLVSKGLGAGRLSILAFGEKRVLVPGTKVMDHARNRRVAISYTLCDGSVVQPVEQLNDIQLEAARRKQAAMLEKN